MNKWTHSHICSVCGSQWALEEWETGQTLSEDERSYRMTTDSRLSSGHVCGCLTPAQRCQEAENKARLERDRQAAKEQLERKTIWESSQIVGYLGDGQEVRRGKMTDFNLQRWVYPDPRNTDCYCRTYGMMFMLSHPPSMRVKWWLPASMPLSCLTLQVTTSMGRRQTPSQSNRVAVPNTYWRSRL